MGVIVRDVCLRAIIEGVPSDKRLRFTFPKKQWKELDSAKYEVCTSTEPTRTTKPLIKIVIIIT